VAAGWTGRELELEVERLAAGGDGVARAPDGRVVFVAGAAPGDRVRARVVAERRSLLRAEVLAVIRAAPCRVEPPCPVFGACGGCAWQHLSADAQLAAKRDILADAVRRIAHLDVPEGFAFHASPRGYGYRSRARLLVLGGRVGYRERGSRALCATDRCPILVPALEAALAALAARPPDRDGELELAVGDDGEVRVTPLPARRGETLRLRAGGEDVELRVSPGGFVQANAALRDTLARGVHEAAGSGACALELHAGAGFLTAGLARRFVRLTAVESHPTAVRDLRANVRRAGLSGVTVVRAEAEAFLAGFSGDRPDAVVLDPPRTGLARGGAAALAALGAPRLVYLSCDPATLARDLRALVDAGYRLDSLAGFDLFPQTPHVEAVAVLERS
jgi:23S rRNA (uracil1939-C5)-methyltransferase